MFLVMIFVFDLYDVMSNDFVCFVVVLSVLCEGFG